MKKNILQNFSALLAWYSAVGGSAVLAAAYPELLFYWYALASGFDCTDHGFTLLAYISGGHQPSCFRRPFHRRSLQR